LREKSGERVLRRPLFALVMPARYRRRF